MKSMNCRSVRCEIEEAAPGELLSSTANDHMKHCVECETFCEKHRKLQGILSGLGTVEAPGDFEFRLRARLAGEKGGASHPFVMRNFSFGFRSAALATILLLIGSALLFVSFRSSVDNTLSTNETKSAANKTNELPNKQNAGQHNAAPPVTLGALAPQTIQSDTPDVKLAPVAQRNNKGLGRPRPMVVASVRGMGQLKTRDLGSTTAPVVKRSDQVVDEYPTYTFPIEAAYQSLKVSLDDGRGSSRTISLPTVSFGSQRVLSQSPSPLLASARGSW